MRTSSEDEPVRLYHLDAASGAIATLAYAPLAEALRIAAAEPAERRAALYIQTRDDVVSAEDLLPG